MAFAPLWSDSFNHESANADLITKWTGGGATNLLGTSYGLNGQGLRLYTNGYLYKVLSPVNPTQFVGAIRIRPVSGALYLMGFFHTDNFFGATGYTHVTLHLNCVTGILTVLTACYSSGMGYCAYSGGTTLGTLDPTYALIPNNWYWVEMLGTIHDSTGTVEVRINGKARITLTSKDTRDNHYGDNSGWNVFGVGNNGSGSVDIDEVHCGDGTEYPGDSRCDCQYPDAVGSDDSWSKSTGTAWECVNDPQVNTSDYIYTSTLNAQTSINLQTLIAASGSNIYAVQVTVYATKMDAGSAGFKIYLRPGGSGTRYYSEEFFPSYGSWAHFRAIWTTNPAGGSWTESDFNTLEAGVEKTT